MFPTLPSRSSRATHYAHAHGMFVVTDADADAIRTAYEDAGELAAVVELRRRFPAIIDNAQARACARTIAGWQPLPEPLRRVRLTPCKKR